MTIIHCQSRPALPTKIGGLRLRGPTAVEVASPLSPQARRILAAWISDGGYSQAVATVIAADPELADQ